MDPVLYYTNTKGYKPVLDTEITFSACTRPWGVEEVRSDAEIVSKLQTVAVFVTRATTEHAAQAFINELPFSLLLRFYSQGFQGQWPFVQLVIEYLQSDSRLIKSLEKIDPDWYLLVRGIGAPCTREFGELGDPVQGEVDEDVGICVNAELGPPAHQESAVSELLVGVGVVAVEQLRRDNIRRRLVETAKRCKDLPMKVRPRKD
ncbi:hypothetical protein F5880DRAFT_903415 [Lentinula raphanica]|nr:hypothetical protein F5880DRAFT_903415 [Lentinula raphanica]